MAIDTALRRYSAINPSVPWRGPSVFPDGAITAPDRRALGRLYSGLAAGTAYLITPTSGVFGWTGSDATLTPTTHINTAQKRFSALHVGNVWRGLNLFPTGSSNRATRLAIGNLYTGFAITANAYTLSADPGAFAWEGEPSFSDFEISEDTGSFAMTGSDAILLATRTAFLTSGVFAMTGRDSTLTKFTGRTLVAVSGVFGQTGSDAVFDRPRSMELSGTAFELIGYETILTFTNENGTEFIGSSDSRRKDAGSNKKRRKHELEVDGQVYQVSSKAEAEHILAQLREEAENLAKVALDRANKAERRPLRKILKDAEKTLQIPVIEAEESISAETDKVLEEINELFSSTLQAIEIAARMRKIEEQEEEEILLMLI